MRWFTIEWYKYLFAKPFNLTKLWCRYRGHPDGPIWFNTGDLEPNMKCQNCGDEI